jgi:hypothetical protein
MARTAAAKKVSQAVSMFGQWPPAYTLASDAAAWFAKREVALVVALALGLLYTAYAKAKDSSAKAAVLQTFAKECGGTLLCVPLWLTPQFINLPGYEQWLAAGTLMVLGDYLLGGPHVNPAVSYAFTVTGDVSASIYLT